jgi:uncharacterized protein YcbX
MGMTVSAICITPVRCFALQHPAEVYLGQNGVVANRRFFLTSPDGERLRSSRTSWPAVIAAHYDAGAELLSLRFPDGSEQTGSALGGSVRRVSNIAMGLDVEVSLVDGPWNEPLSDMAGRPVRIARPDLPGRSFRHPVSMMSDRSVGRLSEAVGEAVDPRRFRMLSVAGCSRPHEEDEWQGRRLRVGRAIVRPGGPIPRCAVTTRDPDTGRKDLDTLRHIHSYRGRGNSGSIDFGVYGEVEEPGTVRVGDVVELL